MVKFKNIRIDSALLFKRYNLRVSTIKQMKAKIESNIQKDLGLESSKQVAVRYIKKPKSNLKSLKIMNNLNWFAFVLIGSNDQNGCYFTLKTIYKIIKQDLEEKLLEEEYQELRFELSATLRQEKQKEIDELEKKLDQLKHECYLKYLLLSDKETEWLMCLRQAFEIISEANTANPENFKEICKELYIDSQEILKECTSKNSKCESIENTDNQAKNAYTIISSTLAHPKYIYIQNHIETISKKYPDGLPDWNITGEKLYDIIKLVHALDLKNKTKQKQITCYSG